MQARADRFQMWPQYVNVSIPIISLMVNVIVQITALRRIVSLGLLKSIYVGFLAGATCVLVVDSLIFFYLPIFFADWVFNIITNLIIYSALGYCYFHFINLGETARRIRILREIYDSGGSLSIDEILEKYNAKEIREKRLSRLLNNQQIVYKDGRYFIGNPTFLFIARAIVIMKLILLGKKSEFD